MTCWTYSKMELAEELQPEPIPCGSSSALQQAPAGIIQPYDDTGSKMNIGKLNDCEVNPAKTDHEPIETNMTVNDFRNVAEDVDALSTASLITEAMAEIAEKTLFQQVSDNAANQIEGGSGRTNLDIEQENDLCKTNCESDKNNFADDINRVSECENRLIFEEKCTSNLLETNSTSKYCASDENIQKSPVITTVMFHDCTEVSEKNGNEAAKTKQETCASNCTAETIPEPFEDSLESTDPEIVNSIEASLTDFFSAQENLDPSMPKTFEDEVLKHESELSTCKLLDQNEGTSSENMCDNNSKMAAITSTIGCDDLTVGPLLESIALDADLTTSVVCKDGLSQRRVENDKLESVSCETSNSETIEVQNNNKSELHKEQSIWKDDVNNKDVAIVSNTVSECETIHKPQEELEKGSVDIIKDMVDSGHVNCDQPKDIDSETSEMTSKVSSETRNVFDVFPDIVDGSEQETLSVPHVTASNSDFKESAEAILIKSGNADEKEKSDDVLNISGNTKFMSYEEFLKSREENLLTKSSTQKSKKTNKKALFKSTKKSYTVKKRTFDSERSILEMAKRRYPGLKELRVEIKSVEDVKDSVQVASEPVEQTLPKEESATSSNARSYSSKSKSHRKVGLRNKSTKGLSYELKSLKEPSIHMRNSVANEKSIPLKKRTRHRVIETVSQGFITDKTKIKNEKGNKKENLKGTKLKESNQNKLKIEVLRNVSGKEWSSSQKKRSLNNSKDKQVLNLNERHSVVESTVNCVSNSAAQMANEKLNSDANVKITGECNIFSNPKESDRKCLPKTIVLKKYPERTCKMKITQEYVAKGAKKHSKDVSLPIVKPKTGLKIVEKKETNAEVTSDDRNQAINKSKKKRKRKVKPWSWGNEKKRSKPKFKHMHSENVEEKYAGMNKDLDSIDIDMTAENQLNVEDAKTSNPETCNDDCVFQTVDLVKTLSNESVCASELTSYVKNATEETNANLESAASDHLEPQVGLVQLVNVNNPLELENILNEDNYQHESPDSGVQSFAGSPSGNESPNSVSLSSNDNSVPNGLNNLPSFSEKVKQSSALSSLSCLTKISLSSNAFVSSVQCATASASVSSYSVTTSLSSSTETCTVFSIASPITSVTLPCTSSNYIDKISTIASSNHSHLVYSTLCPVQSISDTNILRNQSQQHSPSKKKNRAKFLHLHKASTLLQKGRLPTEEEKEQRLEDKFDYLNKHGAKSNCDISLNLKNMNVLTDDAINMFSQPTSVAAICSSNIKTDSKTELTTINASDISQDIPIEMETLSAIPTVTSFHSNSGSDTSFENRHGHFKRKKKQSKIKKTRKRTLSKSNDISLTVESSISVSVNSNNITELPLDNDENVETVSDSMIQSEPLYPNESCLETESFCQDIVTSLIASVENGKPFLAADNFQNEILQPEVEDHDCSDADRSINNDVSVASLSSRSLDEDIEKGIIESEIQGADHNFEVEIFDKLNDFQEKTSESTPEKDSDNLEKDSETLRDVMNGIHSVIKNWDQENKDTEGEFQLTLPISNESAEESVSVQVPLRKRGRPPNKYKKYKKRKLLTLQKYRNKYYYNVNKIKAKGGQPISLKTYQDVIIKRRPGRPKGSKNKERLKEVKEKRPRGRPKGALNKVKKTVPSPSEALSVEVSTIPGINNDASGQEHGVQKSTMMQWRESNVMHGIEGDEKKKRGRPRKKPLPDDTTPKKRGRPALKDKSLQKNKSKKIKEKNNDNVEPVMTGPSDVMMSNESVSKKQVKKKDSKIKVQNKFDIADAVISPAKLDQEVDFESREPAQSISSHDSDTSGAGSHMYNKMSAIRLWEEMSRHRWKTKKKKLLHFRSKHKNIIDPVFNAEVEYLTGVFPRLSISPRGETYLKVRPGEVPLPSIFKIARIDVKKKKKDKLFVFEKSKPIKQKNDELTTKDKIKLGRRISVLGESFMDNDAGSGQKACNLPPKKRHKLFTSPEEGFGRQEKRKVGRPRKQSVTVASLETCAFGDLQRKKDTSFRMGRDGMASFASVALSGCWPGFSVLNSESLAPLTTKASTSGSGDKNIVDKIVQSVDCVSTKEFTHHKKLAKDFAVPVSKKTEKNLFTSFSVSTKETVSKCHDTSNDCESFQETAEDGVEATEITKDSAKIDGSNKRNLKRKLDHPGPVFASKDRKLKPDGRAELQLNSEQQDDTESVRSSVCPDSEPLPVIHRNGEIEGPDYAAHSSERSESVESQESDTSIVKRPSTFQKKRYQRAGLYSASYKDEHSVKEKEMSSIIFTFDPPLHFGNHLMKTPSDFQLPYEVWWLHFNDMLPKKGDGQQYRRIRNNIYVDARPICRNEAHSCNCKTPSSATEKGCGEDCLNRLIYTECSADLCPCGPSCSNQAIQKRQFAPCLQKFLTKDRGFGVRTTKPVKAGDLVTEYVGEVVSEQEFRRRMTEEYSQECHHYCLNLDGRMVIDGYRMGNIARFVNHSCEPNCEMQKWNVNGTYHMCLFALKDIEPGTELVYDYNFQSFNHDAQQICKCGSQDCRGIIGGRRSAKAAEKLQGKGKNKRTKDKRKSKTKTDAAKDSHVKASSSGCLASQGPPVFSCQSLGPYALSLLTIKKKERVYARNHAIFLVRSLDKLRQKLTKAPSEDGHVEDFVKGTNFTKKDVIITQLTAMKTSRSVKTRRLTVAQEDTEVNKMARLASVCREIYSAVITAKDEDGNVLAVPDLFHLPARKKHPWYYQVIQEPIDLTMIEGRILSGEYTSIEAFHTDMCKLFTNVETYCGKKSQLGEVIKQLREVYSEAKQTEIEALQAPPGPPDPGENQSDAECSDNIQVSTPTTSVSSESDISEVSDNKGEWAMEEEEEEVIRCICGIFKDEGLMIQCEKCYIWQHTDCMRVKGDEDNYLCDFCEPRPIDREVEITPCMDDEDPVPDDGNRYYMTLMRDDMQIRLGTCVYVMKENQSKRFSYKKSGGLNKDKMDIFRIERLWKNNRGDKFAFGHTYIRPHETFHEPNRKFFPNEVFRTPLYEIFPLDSIVGYCCVLDLLTYCKGRPKGYHEEDIYICEYRMDKTLHLFYKISPKQRIQVNTKSYCFDMYEKRLNPKRTYLPHEVPESYKRNWRERSTSSMEGGDKHQAESRELGGGGRAYLDPHWRKQKREKVNSIIEALSSTVLSPGKRRHDLSYLMVHPHK
ncbi:uncharacterized protein LOC127880288 isoform X2 [Dreissena polymorpha]|uniref:uncharacterized protein LOC127880288 isoform X2 n=1 Tax=Dreissena polymorpha TaxID=45954 RepID=UPI0022642B3C|nr:uncharacterized protein LOC127880288 isoform X2 [Dreissena polymorpha]